MRVDPLGPMMIGVRELYEELKTVGGKVHRQTAKLDHIDAKVVSVVEDVDDHEARIRALERARWPLPSLAALVSLAGLVFAILAYTRGQ
ncbi:hypothetical protein ACFOWE_32645 [Planomonospora corallina]|uniref:DUF3618 domain-containing protein n=1 Tax=Planomonospora corallina TaxID=1806052 RepID=A0ABV8IJB1_9ACTN